MKELIYMDYNATTPLDPRVLEGMMPYFSREFANASSNHNFGLKIKRAVEAAREQIVDLISANPNDLIFTSGATESINLAIIGYALANQAKGQHLVTITTEHKAVLDSHKYLESIGFEVTYLKVDKFGEISIQELKDSLRPDTLLVSAMLVNNETGLILPIKEMSEVIHTAGASMMCDATQAVGKIPVDVNELGVDLLAFSGHKFYGPKGIGGLYVKNLKSKQIKLQPLQYGGGHETGLRSGTLNVPAIVGIGIASNIAQREMKADASRIGLLRDALENQMLRLPGTFVNGNRDKRAYNVTNICFPGLDASSFIASENGIAISNGSACSSAIMEPSHVLSAMKLTIDNAFSSLRFSLGKLNKIEEIESILYALEKNFTKHHK